MAIKLKGATSGDVTLDVPAVAGTNTITVPAKTGTLITSADTATVTQAMLAANVVGNGPAFNAYATVDQSLTSGVVTKVTFGVEEFDTNNNFASSRFTPTVAGYYLITGFAYLSAAGMTYGYCLLYKNGAAYLGGNFATPYSGGVTAGSATAVVYMNGTTDYVELYAQADGTTPVVKNTVAGYETRLSGALVRAA